MANVYDCNDYLFGEFIPKSKPDTRIMTERSQHGLQFHVLGVQLGTFLFGMFLKCQKLMAQRWITDVFTACWFSVHFGAGAGYARLGPCNVQLVPFPPIGKNHQHTFYGFVLPTVEPVKIPLVID